MGDAEHFRRVPKAEAIINKKYPVLDKGCVVLIDYMGNDARIVNSARVSYKGQKIKRSDKGLISYLMKNMHWSPFEQVQFTFLVKCPIFVARQWFRHRTFKYNEISGRYSILPDEYYVPSLDRIKAQSKKNKQGSDETGLLSNDMKVAFQKQITDEQESVRSNYDYFVEEGIAKELARINLPLSQYTEFYCTGDLRNLFNFLRLRLDDHAQYEIAVYGKVMAEIIKKVVPFAYEAFEDHILNPTSVQLTPKELEFLQDAFHRYSDLYDDGWNDESKKIAQAIDKKLYK